MKFTKSDVVREYIENNPEALENKNRLAKYIYHHNKKLFKDKEQVRHVIRYVTGSKGGQLRGNIKKKDIKINKQFSWNKIPEGEKDVDWENPNILKGERGLILSDIHIPYHNRDALIMALEHGAAKDVDFIYLNGDTMDCFQLSRFIKDPRKRDFKEELDITRDVLSEMRKNFPDVEIYFKDGNHELRYNLYMQSKAPELYGILDFELHNILRLKEMNIEGLSSLEWSKFQGLSIAHGHEGGRSFTNPVSASRGVFLKAFETILIGHHHQPSSFTNNTWSYKPITTWSTGCLCDLHPTYMPKNNWALGFAYVEKLDDDGGFKVDNLRIHNNRIYPV